MRDVNTIRTVNWQLKLDSNGDVVEDLDDIHQSILIILTTPKGSDPLRPEFAMDLWSYQDHPMSEAIPAIIANAVEALRLWEPRISLISLVALEAEVGHLTLQVTWALAGGSTTFTTEVLV